MSSMPGVSRSLRTFCDFSFLWAQSRFLHATAETAKVKSPTSQSLKISSVYVTVLIFSKSQYFTNYASECYFSHKNHVRLTVEEVYNRVLASQ